jgi:hypothetical protein
MSNVYFESANSEEGSIKGRVGQYLSAKIGYQIGFAVSEDDEYRLVESYVTDPQYMIFAQQIPPGLTWDASRGTVSGVPVSPGKWSLTPAVRCRQRGDKVFRGNAYWWTSYTVYEGVTWTKSKRSTTFDISP